MVVIDSCCIEPFFERTERNELAWVCKRKQSHDELSLFELRFTLPLTVHQLINPATLSQLGKSKYSANMGYGCIKQVLITMNGTGEIFVL